MEDNIYRRKENADAEVDADEDAEEDAEEDDPEPGPLSSLLLEVVISYLHTGH